MYLVVVKTFKLCSNVKCLASCNFCYAVSQRCGFWPVCCCQDGETEVQRLVSEMRAGETKHKRELETVREQCQAEVEHAHREGFYQCKTSQITLHTLNLKHQTFIDLNQCHL